MRLFIMVVVLLMVHYKTFGQVQRNSYNPPYAPSVPTFADPTLEVDPLDDLKYGSMYLVKAHSNRLASYGIFAFGTWVFIEETKYANTPGITLDKPNRVLSSLIFASAAAVGINAYIQERKGFERLYLGANGITIKLN